MNTGTWHFNNARNHKKFNLIFIEILPWIHHYILFDILQNIETYMKFSLELILVAYAWSRLLIYLLWFNLILIFWRFGDLLLIVWDWVFSFVEILIFSFHILCSCDLCLLPVVSKTSPITISLRYAFVMALVGYWSFFAGVDHFFLWLGVDHFFVWSNN